MQYVIYGIPKYGNIGSRVIGTNPAYGETNVIGEKAVRPVHPAV
jgi:hypothetical protein